LEQVNALKREKVETEKKNKKVKRSPRPDIGDRWESGTTFRFLWESLYELVLNMDSVLWEKRALEAELELHQLPDSDPDKTLARAAASNSRASAHRAKEAEKVRQARQHLKATKSAREFVQASSNGADPSTSRAKADRKVESAARPKSIFGKKKLPPTAKVTAMNVKPDDLPNLARLASKDTNPVREYLVLANSVWAYSDILLTRVSHIGVRVNEAARVAFRASLKTKEFFSKEEGSGDEEGEEEEEEEEDPRAYKGRERCMVNIGLLRRFFFVTQVTPTDIRSRNASRGAKIARQMDDIYQNTLLNIEFNDQAELTRVVPLFLADFWRNLELQDEAGVYRIPRKPAAVLDAMLAEHLAEKVPEARRDKAVLDDNRVVFWACVLLGGCSAANARVYQMLPQALATPVEASGVFASRFGLHHLTGPAPQIHTLERFVPIDELYDSDGPAPDEDNDGFFVPPDVPGSDAAARSHSFHDLFKLYRTKKHKWNTIRDYGFDGVEKEESGVLPVRTAPVRPHEQDVHRAQAGSLSSPLSQLYQEYLLLVPAGEPEATTLFQRGVSIKRRIQSMSLLMRSLPVGADAYGRPICKSTFSSNTLPWQMKCNAVAQLLHGLAFPSLMSRHKASKWCAQYFGAPYVLPSVYTPTPVVRYLHERLFFDAIHSCSVDGQKGRGLFATPSASKSDTRTARELPLLPAWYRNHKNDEELLGAHKRLTERVSRNPPLATPCIWHLWTPKKNGRGKPLTSSPEPCLVTCKSLSDLYNHSCSARRAQGGDVYQLYQQLGQFYQPVDGVDLRLPLVERGAEPVRVPLRAEPWNFFDQRSYSARDHCAQSLQQPAADAPPSPAPTAASPEPSPLRAAKRKGGTGAKSNAQPRKKQSDGVSGARGKSP
jgi:hypothetical protein